MKWYKLILFIAIGLPAFHVGAQNVESADDSQTFFEEQIVIIQEISPYVERIDKARLRVIERSLESILANIHVNTGAGRSPVTFQTLRLIQNLIVQYRFSKTFLGWTDPPSLNSIHSEVIAERLAQLQILSEQIETEYGYDDTPYTQITAQTFRQMQKLFVQIESLALDVDVKAKLRALWPKLGEVISVAEQGDRPNAFSKGSEMVKSIRALYPIFLNVSSSTAGFIDILEVQGLVEFYAEYAQIEDEL